MDGMSDGELVEQARQGDQEAFGCLVERCRSLLRRVAGRFAADEGTVQDLVQEAILRAYLSLDALKAPNSFRGWLVGILLNVGRGHAREREAGYFSLEALPGGLRFEALPFRAPEIGPEEAAEQADLRRQVRAALEGLPPAARGAAQLFYYEGLSVQETAAALGVSPGAVKVRLHRARLALAERLMPEWLPVDEKRERSVEMVPVRIVDVVKRAESNQHILVLLDETGKRVLPVWVGPYEAMSIALGLRQVSTARPMTFKFIASVLEGLGAELEQARIERLVENTFYGIARLRTNGHTKEVDARPSDVLALAVLTGSPILAAEEVLQQGGIDVSRELEKGLPTGRGLDALLKELEFSLQPAPVPAPAEEAGEKQAQVSEEMVRQVLELVEFVFGGRENLS